MYYQLLVGTHLEGGTTYSVKLETDPETGQRMVPKGGRPIVESNEDLVALFGPEKFRRVTKEEASLLLSESKAAGVTPVQIMAPAAKAKPAVAKAVVAGAVEIAEPPGTDVKDKFPDLVEYPTVNVYFKRGKGYFVVEGGEVKTKEPLKRAEVVPWVQAFMEG
jgi:hypothetical protein